METKPLVPAAQYVRMSTEDQQYSIANQKSGDQRIRKKSWLCGGVNIRRRREEWRGDQTSTRPPATTL